jgi:hypothetical protein
MGYDLRTALHQYTRDPAADLAVIDAEAVTSRVRRGRAARVVTVGVVSTAAAVLLAVAAYGVTDLLSSSTAPIAPAAPSSAAAEPTATATPTPASEAAVAPSPSATSPAVADAAPVFRTGGRVAGFPADAPEEDVTVYLSGHLGMAPEVLDAEYACSSGGVPGSVLGWPGTGLALRVRTTDDAGNVVDPYVAAWTLMEPSGAWGLATDAGLTAGAPRSRVLELYPDAASQEYDQSGGVQWYYTVDDQAGSLMVLGNDDDPIYRIESGYGCGE